jgi:hypothetical protein
VLGKSLASKFNWESRAHPLLPWPVFLLRAALHVIVAFVGIAIADTIGVLGYHYLGQLPWIDSFLNASMILSGMGPVDHVTTTSGRIFSSLYALFSGIFFIVVMGLILAPWAHRIMHRVHLDYDEPTSASGREEK